MDSSNNSMDHQISLADCTQLDGARISTKSQHLDLQIDALKKLAVKKSIKSTYTLGRARNHTRNGITLVFYLQRAHRHQHQHWRLLQKIYWSTLSKRPYD